MGAIYAAFIVNLTRFITWPEGALVPKDAPLLIGTFDRDPINAELDAATRGEFVGGHPLRTIRLRSAADVARCQVVYFSHGVADAGLVLREAEHHPILTVSDTNDFLEMGGHVRFIAQPPHTRLQISAVNLKQSGLEARAQLLRIAATP